MGLASAEKRDLELWWLIPAGIAWTCFLTNRTASWGSDIWMYLSVGREVLENGIPSKLVFTFGEAAEQPYFAYEWLSSVTFHLVELTGGTTGLELFRYTLAIALFLALYVLYYSISRNRVTALILAGIVIGLAWLRLKLRAELFGYISFVLTLCCLVRFRASGRARDLAYALPIMLVWVNSHGSYLLGFLLPPLFALSAAISVWRRESFRIDAIPFDQIFRESRPYLLVWLGVLLCGLCNPYGIMLWKHSIELSFDPFIPKVIDEWRPTLSYLGKPTLIPYFAMVALVTTAVAVGHRRLHFHSWVLLAAFGYLSLSAVRHRYLFMFVSGAIIADACAGLFSDVRAQRRLYAAFLAVVLLFAAPVFIRAGNPLVVLRNPVDQGRDLSRRCIRFIEQSGMSGPVVNDFNLGDYLVYNFHPRIAVSMDSRIDAYGERLFQRNREAMKGAVDAFPGSPQHMVALPGRARRLLKTGFLQQHPDWRLVFRDSSAAIFSRDRRLWPRQ